MTDEGLFGLFLIYVFLIYVVGMIFVFGLVFDDENYKGPTGFGRDGPRKCILIGLFWPICLAFWCVYLVKMIVWDFLVCNRRR